jgi:hypothetical protein
VFGQSEAGQSGGNERQRRGGQDSGHQERFEGRHDYLTGRAGGNGTRYDTVAFAEARRRYISVSGERLC